MRANALGILKVCVSCRYRYWRHWAECCWYTKCQEATIIAVLLSVNLIISIIIFNIYFCQICSLLNESLDCVIMPWPFCLAGQAAADQLAQQKQLLNKRLGLDVAGRLGSSVADDELFKEEDLIVINSTTSQQVRQNSFWGLDLVV